MTLIRSIADIPFRERDPWSLLNIDPRADRSAPDMDYYGFGYTRVDEVWLTAEDDREPPPPVRDVLLLALHSADDSDYLADDILLEFWPDDDDDDGDDAGTANQAASDEEDDDDDDEESITVMLSRFLDIWLPRLSSDERTIVLVLCNPHRATIARPRLPAEQPIYYAFGDVVSLLDGIDSGRPPVLRLIAEAWHKV